MGGRNVSWDRHKNAERSRGATIKRRRDGGDVYSSTLQHQWEADIAFLEGLMPKLSPRHKRKAEESLGWLREVPGRTLGDDSPRSGRQTSWRTFYNTLSQLIQAGKYDPDFAPDEGRMKAARTRRRLRQLRREELKGDAPDWVSDRSMLPKKPPGAMKGGGS